MSQFKSKAQRKAVMRLLKQYEMNIRYAHKQLQSKKGEMSFNDISKHIDQTMPYPKNIDVSKRLSEHDHDIFMNKAYFKGRKGIWKPKMFHSSTDKDGKKYYQVSALSTTKHDKYY